MCGDGDDWAVNQQNHFSKSGKSILLKQMSQSHFSLHTITLISV